MRKLEGLTNIKLLSTIFVLKAATQDTLPCIYIALIEEQIQNWYSKFYDHKTRCSKILKINLKGNIYIKLKNIKITMYKAIHINT